MSEETLTLSVEAKAVRAACCSWNGDLDCTFPECVCAKLPNSVRAAISAWCRAMDDELAQL